jgi:6-pyruvoyltetrahydropterin/6-carboxytetrahydropterin synthase
MYTLNYKHSFDAAHKLPLPGSKCANLHGHTWTVEVEIECAELKNGMILDFSVLRDVIDELDHGFINDILENPTAENIADMFACKIHTVMDRPCGISVTVWESPDSSIRRTL